MSTPQSKQQPKELVKKAWRVRSSNGLIPQAVLYSYGKYTAETEYRIRFDISDKVELITEEVSNGGA